MSVMHVATMSDLQHKDDHLMIFKAADHPLSTSAPSPRRRRSTINCGMTPSALDRAKKSAFSSSVPCCASILSCPGSHQRQLQPA